MKWNLKKIMLRAWSLYRKGGLTFGEALHRAWLTAKVEPINAATVENAKAAAGITEEVRTWSGWRELGYEVMHGSKALFGCALIWGARETVRYTTLDSSALLKFRRLHEKSPLPDSRPKQQAKSLKDTRSGCK